MQLTTIRIDKPDATNFILGQTHFIKSVEDIHEALVGAVPRKFATVLRNELVWSRPTRPTRNVLMRASPATRRTSPARRGRPRTAAAGRADARAFAQTDEGERHRSVVVV